MPDPVCHTDNGKCLSYLPDKTNLDAPTIAADNLLLNIFCLELYPKEEIKNHEYFFTFNDEVGISWPNFIKTYDSSYENEWHPNAADHEKLSNLFYENFFINKTKT